MALSGITPEYLAFLEPVEGLVLHPYLCQAGKPTIGRGHRIPSMDHPDVTEEWANDTLAEDLVRYRANAMALSPGLADEPEARQSAVIDFCFNAGATNYGNSTLRRRVNEKNWPAAGTEMRRWVYAHKDGKPIQLAGLVRRRETTAGWLEKGAY